MSRQETNAAEPIAPGAAPGAAPNPATPDLAAKMAVSRADPHEIRSFARLLELQEGGDLNAELSEDIEAALEAMRAAHLAGARRPKATITLKIALQLDDGLVEAMADKSVAPPKPPRRKARYWPGKAGGLSTANPRQFDMGFRDVHGGGRDPRPV